MTTAGGAPLRGEKHFRGLEGAYRAAPVTRWMGTSATVGDGRATVTLPIRGDFHHAASAVHGSLYFRMLDDAAFFAANSRVPDVLVLTSSFHIRFFRPVTEGRLRAEGRVVNQSRRVVSADAELFDDRGNLLAQGSGTFMPSEIPLSDVEGYESGNAGS